jgi:hypothetical protein
MLKRDEREKSADCVSLLEVEDEVELANLNGHGSIAWIRHSR